MEKKITMQTIAQALGISKVTVHKAFTNQSGVSNIRKKEILETAKSLGYKFKQESALPACIYFLIPKKYFFDAEQFYTRIYYHLNNECQTYGAAASVELVILEDMFSCTEFFTNVLRQKKSVSVFVGGQIEKKHLQQLQAFGFPVICIDYYSRDFPFDYVLIENYSASYHLTKYLLDVGHERIGFVGDFTFAASATDRYLGYYKAMLLYGIDVDNRFNIPQNIEKLPDFNLIQLPKVLPTAFICYCDLAAKQLYQKLRSCNLRIPEDISIISFDNTALAGMLNPPLSSCGASKKQIAKSAFHLLQKRLHNSELPSQSETIYPTLTVRNSVKELL